MSPTTRLAESGKLRGAVRALGIFLLLIAAISIHFFTTPAPVRIANLLLAGGLLLTLGSLWPVRGMVLERLRAIPSGAQLLNGLWVWLTDRMESIEGRVRGWHVAAMLVALFLLSLVGSRGGIVDVELDLYIPHYLSGRPFLAKAFDSTRTEVNVDPNAPVITWHGRQVKVIEVQRPRPFSYMVDCLDTQFIAWSVSKGFPHVLSASIVVFLVIDYIIVWIFCRRYLLFDRFTSGLLVCILASDPVFICNLSFFRSAKPGTSTFLLAALCVMAGLLVRRREFPPGAGRTLRLVAVPVLLLIACLFDEQAVFMTGILAVALLIEWRFPAGTETQTTARRLLSTTVGVIVVFGVYGVFIHPRLCAYFSDVPPFSTFDYQSGALSNVAREIFARTWQCIFLLMDQFRFLTGCQVVLPAILMMLWMGSATAAGAAVLAAPDRADKGTGTRRGVLRHLSIATALLILTLGALCSRHEWLLRYDMRRWLYSEPSTMMLMFFLLLATAAVLHSRRFRRPVVQLALVGMLVGNLWMLPEHRRFLRSEYWMPRLDFSLDFISALKKNARDIPPEVAASPAYQALRPYVPAR